MWNQYTKTTSLTFIPDTNSDDIFSDRKELSWNSILEMLSTHHVTQNKEDCALFLPVIWKDNDKLTENSKKNVRTDLNVDAITMTVLDLDDPGAIEEAVKVFGDFDYVIYSTHSFSKETPYKARIAIRHEEPLPANKLNEYMHNLAHCVRLDSACRNMSRAFYMPSITPEASKDLSPIFISNSGRGIGFEDSVVLKETMSRIKSPEEKKLLDSIFTSSKPTYDASQSSLDGFGAKYATGEYSASDSATSFDYADLVRDNKKLINEALRYKNSRWEFARGVIYKAVGTNVDKVDWHNLVQFMYQSIQKETAKTVDGETISQLDNLIRTSFDKLTPEFIKENPGYADQVMAQVNKACAIADKSSKTGVWYYNENPVKRKLKDAASGIGLSEGFDYKSILDRNRSSDYALAREDDVVGYIIDVFKNELKLHKDEIELNSVGEFAIVRASKYLHQRKENISTYKDAIFNDITISDIDPQLTLQGEDRDNMDRFLKTSLKLGYLSATKKREIKMAKEVNNEGTLER